MELSEGTSRALRILNKGREYLAPKLEEDLDSDSAEEHSNIQVQQVHPIKTVVLGEGISQISESRDQTALASTSSTAPDDVANTVEGYDNIGDDMQQYVNANCSGKWSFNSKYLRKIQIVVSEGKYKRKKSCSYCPFEDIKDATMGAKLYRQLQSFHQRELRISNLRRINLEIEELEESKEIATTERDLKKLHEEKDQTYRLITYEGQYKYNIAIFKKCIDTNRFTDKLLVVRDPTVTENQQLITMLLALIVLASS